MARLLGTAIPGAGWISAISWGYTIIKGVATGGASLGLDLAMGQYKKELVKGVLTLAAEVPKPDHVNYSIVDISEEEHGDAKFLASHYDNNEIGSDSNLLPHSYEYDYGV